MRSLVRDASSLECPLLSDKLSSLPLLITFFKLLIRHAREFNIFRYLLFSPDQVSSVRKLVVVRNSDRIGHEQPLIFLKRSLPLLRYRPGRKFVYDVFEFSD